MRRPSILTALFCLLGAAAAQAAASATYVPRMERVAACSWDRPGHNPFMGDVVAAVDRYTDIPSAVRVRLKQRMQARQYDDFVDIRRDSISGRMAYEPTIRDMHFGLDQVCRRVTRERWTAQTHERGVVYCEQDHCILVPTVCRNVSRIERRPAMVAGEPSREAAQQAATGSPAPHGPSETSSERTAAAAAAAAPTRGPEVTSSFAEAVAGATLPLWPTGSEDGASPGGGGGAVDTGPGGTGAGAGPTPWWSTPVGGAPPRFPGVPGSEGGSGTGGGGMPDGGNGDDGGSGMPGGGVGGNGGMPDGGGSGSIGGVPDGAEGLPGGNGSPVSPIPEPATWASLLLGLALLALVSARRRRPG